MDESDYNRRYGGSPVFENSNLSMNAGDWFNINYGEGGNVPSAEAYGRMTEITLRHGSTAGTDRAIKIYFNGDYVTVRSVLIPGQIRRFTTSDLRGGIRSIHIYNAGSLVIAAGDIEVLAERKPVDQDQIIREEHRRLVTGQQVPKTW